MGAGLRRHRKAESVAVEIRNGHDGQGAPAYDDPETILMVILTEASGLKRSADGEETPAETELMVSDLAQSPLPGEGDRLTLPSGAVRIVASADRVRDRRGNDDHLAVTAMEE